LVAVLVSDQHERQPGYGAAAENRNYLQAPIPFHRGFLSAVSAQDDTPRREAHHVLTQKKARAADSRRAGSTCNSTSGDLHAVPQGLNTV
jgi:hypothetical protein